MEQKRIPIKGINRSFDDGISDDGCCMELINARIKNGSVEPVGKPIEITALSSSTSKLYFHAQAGRMLNITTSGIIYAYNAVTYEYTQQMSSDLKGAKRIEFIGNMAVFFMETTTRYCIFKDGSYQYLGEKPNAPYFVCEPWGATFGVSPETKFLVGRDSDGYSTDEFYSSLTYAESGLFDNCIDTANKLGYFFGKVFIMCALRMYDGSYCSFSPIMLVESANDVSYSFDCGQSKTQRTSTLGRTNPFESCYADPTNATKRNARCEAAVYCMTPNLRLGNIVSSLKAWKELIVAIDFFVAPFSFAVKHNTKYRTGTEYSRYTDYRTNEQKEDEIISNATTFYKYAEYDLDGVKQWMLEDVSTDNLALQPRLQLSDIMYPVAAYASYVYNNRMHIAQYRQYFWSKFSLNLTDNTYPKGDSDTTPVYIYYYIRTDEGESIIKAYYSSTYKRIAPYLMYYDNRAYKVLVAWQNTSTDKWYGKEFPLTKSKTINLAYYAHKDQLSSGKYTLALAIDLSTFPEINTLPTEKNTFIIKNNVLKVSGLYNPVSFPAAQTYQPSQASIIGFCSNTQALSQGQFGQHPLYVFTRDGIYAMNVDTSGGIVYSSQTPVSRDVCINASTICGIDSSVLFASDRGLMAISGSTVTHLSADLDGYLPSCIDSSPIISKIAAIASMEGKLSKTEFRNYLDGALSVSIAYIYATGEIVVSNKQYTYSYLYNMQSGTWSKVDYVIQQMTNHYPEPYAVIKEADSSLHLRELYNPHRSETEMLLLTKPVKMGTNSHKRVLQSALRAVIHPSKSDLYFRGEPVMFRGEQVDAFSNAGLYILGSNDAEHFQLVHGKESIKDVRDLVSKMNKSSAYKYFMIALVGGVRTDISINYMEFLIDDAYTNRLR